MWAQIAFSRSEQFQNLLNTLFELREFNQDDVVGVTVDFHPLWWRLATLWHQTGIDYPAYWEWLIHQGGPLGLPLMPRPDPMWRSKPWLSLCEEHGKKEDPFLVKICFRTETDNESRRRLIQFAREQSLWCVTEERRLAVAASSFEGGRDITANEPGTLGGFLKDKHTNRILGVTCAHVGQIKGTSVSLEDSLGKTYHNAGTVVESSFSSLVPLAPGQSCNRAVPGVTKRVDAALLELNGPHTALNTVASVGTIDAIFDAVQFGSGDPVEMRGAASKHNNFYIGAYDAVYKVLFKSGNIHCFEHLFEINRNSLTLGLIPPALAAKAVQGDSGACVCCTSPTGNYAYCGTLVAVDGTNGYACFAEVVRDWAAGLMPPVDLAPI